MRYGNTLLKKNPIVNFINLIFSKGINIIIPILVIPFLLKRIGVVNFGKVSLIQSIILFYSIIINYGFDLTAVRDIAQNINNKLKINLIFSEVLFIRSILLIILFPLYMITCSFFLNIKSEYSLFILSYLLIIGNAILPDWYFQGVQKMSIIVLTNLISKLIYLILLFFVITNKDNYTLVNFALGLSIIITSITVYYFIYKIDNIKFIIKVNTYILKTLKNNLFIVGQGLAIWGYTGLGIFLINKYHNHILGEFSAIDKINSLIYSFGAIYLVATYPLVCNLNNSHIKKHILKNLIPFVIIYIFIGLLSIYLFNYIQFFTSINNPVFLKSFRLTLIEGFIILTINTLPYQILLSIDKKKIIFYIISISLLVNFFLSVFLIKNYGIVGVNYSRIIAQLSVGISLTLYLIYYFNKNERKEKKLSNL